jgi:acetyl esterase
MPLDPGAQAVLELMESSGMFAAGMSPEEARAAMAAATSADLMPRHPLFAVDDRTIPGPAGEIPVRVYRPSATPALPILMWLHGGGWVIGNLETHDNICRQLCDAAGVIVVSVDYRLAPEHKFPAAVDDAVAAWKWVNDNAIELGGDARRIAVGGDSAGGNLAAVVALVAREEGLPAPRLQLLVYPVTDRETESPSMIENATGYFLEAERMDWFWDLYAASAADHGDWRYSPMRVADCAGLPRAVVITAEFDPLRDQGEAYGERLRAAGVETEILRADGLFHGFFGMHAFMSAARPPWDTSVAALQDACGVETK